LWQETGEELIMADIDQSRRNKKPRLLQDGERARLEEFIDAIGYSAR
jgi:cyclin-dependent kinase regulatory subunit CKS1